ncbi:glycosyltransferase family 4 protein [Gloeocapsa sp. PCC 73106]|uniref:glycosyltransferase family 4 protein n=1 Tax=Gloeocapsa sp. PCC 73106 TaxID=102232 RepID=UPI0002AC72AB|nr:glycosyltransferase family 4 protein [Gloeocapsa sp. PCC 73106]ELR96297.1 glycosyltransferase [Gloeocapsa sp. PCC 73106]
MRIAYMTSEYPRATDTFIQREIEALRLNGAEVYTFSIRRTGDEHIVGPEQQKERDNTFYVLPPNILRLLLSHLTLLFTAPGRYFKTIVLAWSTRRYGVMGTIYQLFYFLEAGVIAQEIRQKDIQHLHNHFGDSSCSVAMLASSLGGFTYSFSLHGPYIFFNPYGWRLDEKIKRALFVSCISHYCRSQGMILGAIDNWSKMYIVHCGVDPDLYELVPHAGLGLRLLYLGRLAGVKGLPILFESIASLKTIFPDLVLNLVGDGEERAKLEAMVTELDIVNNVQFLGYQSQAEVRKRLQATDIYVLPSFAEGISVSLMEAMAAGVPVVTTQIAGVNELVDNGISGYIVPAGDAISLTDKLKRLITDPELRNTMGKAGRLKVETEFNLNLEANWLAKIMREYLSGKPDLPSPRY